MRTQTSREIMARTILMAGGARTIADVEQGMYADIDADGTLRIAGEGRTATLRTYRADGTATEVEAGDETATWHLDMREATDAERVALLMLWGYSDDDIAEAMA